MFVRFCLFVWFCFLCLWGFVLFCLFVYLRNSFQWTYFENSFLITATKDPSIPTLQILYIGHIESLSQPPPTQPSHSPTAFWSPLLKQIPWDGKGYGLIYATVCQRKVDWFVPSYLISVVFAIVQFNYIFSKPTKWKYEELFLYKLS